MDVFAVGRAAEPDAHRPRARAARPPPCRHRWPPSSRRATAIDPRLRPRDASALGAELARLREPGCARGSEPADELPADELSWMRAVALTLAGATAVALYALLVSVTPRVHAPGDTLPFVVLGERAPARRPHRHAGPLRDLAHAGGGGGLCRRAGRVRVAEPPLAARRGRGGRPPTGRCGPPRAVIYVALADPGAVPRAAGCAGRSAWPTSAPRTCRWWAARWSW